MIPTSRRIETADFARLLGGEDAQPRDGGASGERDSPREEHTLEVRGLCAIWYVRRRLEEELDRSRRAGHHLSVVTLGPSGDASPALLDAAGAAIKATARASDIVGWLDPDAIVVVMPDGDEKGSSHAAKRWARQIWLKTMQLGAVKWQAHVLADTSSFKSADDVLNTARRGLRALLAPRRW
jgi:hypothetical protein